ncbi:MAG: tetratricopeptide repeat protein [Ilumatobacter sp.]
MNDGEFERLHAMLDDGRADDVVAAARQGLATTPYHERYRALLIDALIQLGDVDGAREQAQFGVSELPGSALLHRLLACSLLASREWPAAVDASDAAVRLDPGGFASLCLSAETRAALAASLAARSKEQRAALDAAEQAAHSASLQSPESAEPHFLAARVALIGREWTAAKLAAERGLAIEPDSADGHAILSEAMLGTGDVPGAGAHARIAIEREPDRLDVAEILDHAGPPIWQWSVAGMAAFVPVASALDGSFEPWMWLSGALGVGGLAWLKFAPSNRVDAETAASRRRSQQP